MKEQEVGTGPEQEKEEEGRVNQNSALSQPTSLLNLQSVRLKKKWLGCVENHSQKSINEVAGTKI